MSEKRGFERLLLDGDVFIKTKGRKPLAFKAFLDNISFGGFAMFSLENLKADRVVEFRLMTKSLGEALVGRGRTRHITRPPQYDTPLYTVGVEFEKVNKDLVLHIIHRLQAEASLEAQRQNQNNPKMDFIPF